MDITKNSEIEVEQLFKNPYPIYKKLREEEPVCFVNSLNKWLVTRWDDCKYIEENPSIFSANEAATDPMTTALGLTMLRQDGDAHKRLRMAVEQPLRPKAVRDNWTNIFREDANELIDRFAQDGNVDLVKQFSAPFAGRTLKRLLSLDNVSDQQMVDWSQTFMDVLINNDPATLQRNKEANKEINDAIDEMIPFVIKKPNNTILSSMVHTYEDEKDKLTIEEIRADVKLCISGGLNEPRDAISSLIWLLLENPEQRKLVTDNPQLYSNAAEEAIRLIAPVGAYPRTVASDTKLNGVELKKGEKVFVCIASANRDEQYWDNPDQFDITREKVKGHMAFSMGSHYCVGAWMARLQLAVSVPLLIDRLPNLRLNPNLESKFWGFGFRGPLNLHLNWDA